jgi:predicted transport protein
MNKNKRSLKTKSAETAPVKEKALPKAEPNFTNSYVLTDKGNLIPRRHEPFHEEAQPIEQNFANASELENIIYSNRQVLFGDNTMLLNGIPPSFIGLPMFESMLVNFREIAKPRLFFIRVHVMKDYFPDLLMNMTDYFAFLKKPEMQSKLVDSLTAAIMETPDVRKDLKQKIGDLDIMEFWGKVVTLTPIVLLLLDNLKPELKPVMETYVETWGEIIKPIVVRKFKSNGDTLITMENNFEFVRKGKKERKANEEVKLTEEAHLFGVSENVKVMYGRIKEDLLKSDPTLSFKVSQNYIALRKNQGLAFFHLRNKSIYLVVKCKEGRVREVIKHSIIKSLPASVQRFWNGDSTGLFIESIEHLDEVITLLKEIAGIRQINGNKMENAESKAQNKVKAQKPDKKLKPKKK